MIHIAVENHSTVIGAADYQSAVAAAQVQVLTDFRRAWGFDAIVRAATAVKDEWVIRIFDDSDQAGALGYHDDPTGIPTGSVFARTAQQAGLSWTVTLTHELLELLVDPYIVGCVQMDASTFVAQEVCDAPEDDSNGYLVNGVLCTDFVTPSWFDSTLSGPWSHSGKVPGSFQLLPGGYIGVWTQASGWTQKTGDLTKPEASKHPTGRHARFLSKGKI
jgi:hypothetical protein